MRGSEISRYAVAYQTPSQTRLISIFQGMIRTLDAANARLESTMGVLRSTMVEAIARHENEKPQSLMEFIDEESMVMIRDALKESIRKSK
jgi:autophagy-related protein 17